MLQQDATITTDGGTVKEVKAGERLDLGNKSNFLVESTGYVSVLIVPVEAGAQELAIDLKVLENRKLNKIIGASLNKELSKVLLKVNDIQKLLMENKGQLALSRINEVQQEYTNLDYLDFLKVSAYVMLGERSNAKQLLEQSLTKYPDNKQAKKLYETMFGGSARGSQ